MGGVGFLAEHEDRRSMTVPARKMPRTSVANRIRRRPGRSSGHRNSYVGRRSGGSLQPRWPFSPAAFLGLGPGIVRNSTHRAPPGSNQWVPPPISRPSDGSVKNIRFVYGNCAVQYPASVEIGWAFRVACREADDHLTPVRHGVFGALSGGRRWQEGARYGSAAAEDEWVVYAAFLPALLTSGGIGATAALEWHTQKPWHVPIERAVCVETDDYVQGLAKRGIAKLPGYGPPANELSTPAIAAAALYARNACQLTAGAAEYRVGPPKVSVRPPPLREHRTATRAPGPRRLNLQAARQQP